MTAADRDEPEVWVESPDVAYPDPSNAKTLHTFTDEELAARDRAVMDYAADLIDRGYTSKYLRSSLSLLDFDRTDTLGEDT